MRLLFIMEEACLSSIELINFVAVRNNELSADEILHVIDITKNPTIDHIVYENNIWNIWTQDGKYVQFTKRNW